MDLNTWSWIFIICMVIGFVLFFVRTDYRFYGIILVIVGIIGSWVIIVKSNNKFENTVNNMIANGAEVYLDGQLIEHPDKLDLDDYKIEIHGDYILLKKPIPMPATIYY